MSDEQSLLELCEYIVKKAQQHGATAVEAQATFSTELEAQIELAQISGVNRKIIDEIAIRLYIGKNMGSAFLNIPTHKAADEAIGLAIAAAQVNSEDPDWIGLSKPATYADTSNLWRESVESCDPSEVVKLTGELISRSMQALPGMIPAFGGAGAMSYHSAYANSNGVSVSERETISYAFLGAVAQVEWGMTPMVGAYNIARDLSLDIDNAISEAASVLKICQTLVHGETGNYTVIMSPHAYSQLFNFTLIQSLRGDNVVRGKSLIADRIGEPIASEMISIADDGTHPMGMFTSKSDDEGVPRQRTSLIEHGVLKSFLWDTYWANKRGVESTGNAKRDKRQGIVEIGTTNIVIEPGTRSITDIISEIDHGYYIRNVQGAHSSNPESGDFSIVGNPAMLIRDGEFAGSVQGLMVAGNVFELLKNVSEIAKDPSYLIGLIGPEIVFKDVKIVTN